MSRISASRKELSDEVTCAKAQLKNRAKVRSVKRGRVPMIADNKAGVPHMQLQSKAAESIQLRPFSGRDTFGTTASHCDHASPE